MGMTQTSTATRITAQIAEARTTMQYLIATDSPLRARQERLINALKDKLATA